MIVVFFRYNSDRVLPIGKKDIGGSVMGQNKKRDQFRTQFGFIVACIGSAVGMGNIWMFPYRTGKFGGAAFLIPYFILYYYWAFLEY